MDAHWLAMPILQQLNSGVLVLSTDYGISFYNQFIERRLGVPLAEVRHKSVFDVFTDLPEAWLKRKLDSVVALNAPTFSSWEQRPYVLKLPHLRPVSGGSDYMMQNCSMLPLVHPHTGETFICLLIEDATDVSIYQLELQRNMQALQQANRLDGLTKLYNRSYWEQLLQSEVLRAKRYHQPLSLILFDLDKFKQLNDDYGHLGGDFVLIELASFIQSLLRESDFLGRYGGEEFGIILPNTSQSGANEVAERICRQVAAHQLLFNQRIIRATISLGVAELNPHRHQEAHDLLQCADVALYVSKRQGRNRSTCYRDDLQKVLQKVN
ncbi:sensor domain-containing diguanylate cyclase [Alkalimonas amylolytica]|uniref:diguanylate cyclase n=1 Tax=Alkalimonas amylolytica TaxID=152573 RepID=A0A1H3XAX0_ALKAM|nr:GGDEF domain-containing protein [Alkalimonas amylolytica]SDZ96535.1 diguanylate cyclase (GGDEF) domain-containing protein [Alkalimonas amylolytica]